MRLSHPDSGCHGPTKRQALQNGLLLFRILLRTSNLSGRSPINTKQICGQPSSSSSMRTKLNVTNRNPNCWTHAVPVLWGVNQIRILSRWKNIIFQFEWRRFAGSLRRQAPVRLPNLHVFNKFDWEPNPTESAFRSALTLGWLIRRHVCPVSKSIRIYVLLFQVSSNVLKTLHPLTIRVPESDPVQSDEWEYSKCSPQKIVHFALTSRFLREKSAAGAECWVDFDIAHCISISSVMLACT